MTVEVCYTINPWIMLISRATECWRSTPHCGSEGDHSSPVGMRGIDQLESYDFGAERKRLKSPDLVSDKQTAQWAFTASSPR